MMQAQELWVTIDVARRLLGLAPVLEAVPALRGIWAEWQKLLKEDRSCGCKANTLGYPIALKVAAALQGASEPAKAILLDALKTDSLWGFVKSPDGVRQIGRASCRERV